MKVGIMTWFQYHNYGTSLQLYAMNEVIRKMGFEPYVINYHARKPAIDGAKNSLKRKIYGRADRFFFPENIDELRDRKFQQFINENITFTNPCNTLPELEHLNGEMDAFVCGSDQIWCPNLFDKHYYLDFVWDSGKKIAYAPSLGLTSVEDDRIKSEIKKYATKIDYLSTREKSGSDIIEALTGRKVNTVLDPTLLMRADEWGKLGGDISHRDDKYLLVYMLGHKNSYWKRIKTIARKLGYKVLIIPTYKKDLGRHGCINEIVGPEEFLGLVKNAAYICTDSYHGMLFAIQYHVAFSVFERFNSKSDNNQNSRIYQVLEDLGLQDRLVRNSSNKNICVCEKIDWDDIDNRLQELRNRSWEYLNKSFESVNSTLKKIVGAKKYNNIKYNSSLCCGCGVCASECTRNAITLRHDREGFIVAMVDDSICTNCGYCREVCPFISGIDGYSCHDGELYSFKSKSRDVLMNSASGGAAYSLGKLAIQEGYKVIGCTFDKNEQKAKHILVSTTEELKALQGSKYLQSDFASVVNALKSTDKIMVFGTPCQIAAAKKINNGQDRVYVDLICHGVPTDYLLISYKDYIRRKKRIDDKELDITFRYKPKGWKKRYIRYAGKSKNIIQKSEKDPFYLCFLHETCYSENCYECPWRDKSKADIRLGDYWGKRYAGDKTGVSMLLSLSNLGKKWVRKLIDNKFGDIEITPVDDYYRWQQVENLSEPLFRQEIIDRMRKGEKIEILIKDYVSVLIKEQKMRELVNMIREHISK